MEKKADYIHDEEWLKKLPVQAEDFAFKPEEMITCGACRRTNPPTRLKCFYCGGELEISEAQSRLLKPNLRKLELWEKGFNLICKPPENYPNEENTAEIAKLVNLEKETLEKILAAKKALPIARVESEKEAEILQNRLNELNLETFTVSDERLASENLPKRLRGLEFLADSVLLILFNNDEVEELQTKDFCLMVSGAIFQKAVESTEARKKGNSKILDVTETASDEGLIDIYSKNDSTGYRILTKGFDFSCLGAEKGILARENIKKLIIKLQNFAANAKLVDDYQADRAVLGAVWEIEAHKDSQGLARKGFGKFDLSNVSSTSNLQQFTKYSRLQWHIL